MDESIQFLVATTKRDTLSEMSQMNIKSKAVFTNQSNSYGVEITDSALMLSTATIGVGINRNLGLNIAESDYVLLCDDDMYFFAEAEEIIRKYISENPKADVVIFNFEYSRDGIKVRDRITSSRRLRWHNCLHYGICCTLVKLSTLKQKNISFTTLFGGGCKYSCGEDSLFFLDCIRKKMRVYQTTHSLGKNEYRESTWFKGYNEKYFFDKGAWTACAFPKAKHLLKWYFAIKLKSKSQLSFRKIVSLMNKGIRGFKTLEVYKATD